MTELANAMFLKLIALHHFRALEVSCPLPLHHHILPFRKVMLNCIEYSLTLRLNFLSRSLANASQLVLHIGR